MRSQSLWWHLIRLPWQALRGVAVEIHWDVGGQTARLVSRCPLKAGTSLSDASLLIGESSQAVAASHGLTVLSLLQSMKTGAPWLKLTKIDNYSLLLPPAMYCFVKGSRRTVAKAALEVLQSQSVFSPHPKSLSQEVNPSAETNVRCNLSAGLHYCQSRIFHTFRWPQ